MNKLERIEAEYSLAKLESEFAAKKLAGDLTVEDRHMLREVREAYRNDHRLPVAEGATPNPIGAKTKWQRIMAVLKDDN